MDSTQLCRARRAFALKIEPDIEDTQDARRKMQAVTRHFDTRHSSLAPFSRARTILLDLTKTEDEILAAMNQKTRYNIRLAARKGVVVREGTADDLPAFYALTQITGARDGFGVHSADYYRAAFELFVPRGWARLFVAEVHEAGIEPAADCRDHGLRLRQQGLVHVRRVRRRAPRTDAQPRVAMGSDPLGQIARLRHV